MNIDTTTGEVLSTGAIRPALETLRELPGVLDQVAIGIHNAMAAVREHQKPAKIVLTITIDPWKDKSTKLIDEPVLIAGEVETKLPKHEPPKALFYSDDDGNPTRQQKRQPDLGLSIAGADSKAA